MASRKNLKKEIKRISAALLAECMAASLYSHGIVTDDLKSMLYSIAKLESNYINRVSHIEPGMPAKTYFRDLISKFNAEISEIIDQINMPNS